MRHLLHHPNSVLSEQSLVEILNPTLLELNLSNQYWVSMEMLGTIGYLAPNLQKIDLTSIEINDGALLELGKSCKNLTHINLSSCSLLTPRGISDFIRIKSDLELLNLEFND